MIWFLAGIAVLFYLSLIYYAGRKAWLSDFRSQRRLHAAIVFLLVAVPTVIGLAFAAGEYLPPPWNNTVSAGLFGLLLGAFTNPGGDIEQRTVRVDGTGKTWALGPWIKVGRTFVPRWYRIALMLGCTAVGAVIGYNWR